MQLHIRHETQYSYSEPVKRSVQSLRLTPRQEAAQHTLSWTISAPGRQYAQQDAHGNIVHLLTIDQPHRNIHLVVHGVVETDEAHCTLLHEPGTLAPLTYLAATSLTRPDAALETFANKFKSKDRDLQTNLLGLANAVCEHIEYERGVTDVRESAAEAFARRKGVCQDHAHVFLACARCIGVPARYVSGYYNTGKRNEVTSHAWVDVWLGPDSGWLGIDVTHRFLVNGQHCRLAVGRDYLEACPVRGVRRGGGREAMEVAVTISAAQQ